MKKITGVILAGGKSSRMGSDKGMLMIKGKKMIEHIINALEPNVDEIIIIANNENYNNLGFKVYGDLIKECGPLAGIYTALQNSETNKNFIVSCDIPNLTSEAVSFLISKLKDEDVMMPVLNGHIEPLCAVYSKVCADEFKSCIDNGNYKIKDALENINTTYIDVSLETKLFTHVFENINTPTEYEQQKEK